MRVPLALSYFVVAVVEGHFVGGAATRTGVRRCERAAQRAIQRVVGGVAALVARIGLREPVAIGIVGILPGGVSRAATIGGHRRVGARSQIRIVHAQQFFDPVVHRAIGRLGRAGAVGGRHRDRVAQHVVDRADRAHHAVGAARSTEDLGIARATQPIGVGDGLVLVGIQRDGLFVGSVALAGNRGHAQRDRIAHRRFLDDRGALAVGHGAQGAVQGVTAGHRAWLVEVGGHVARGCGKSVGQAPGRGPVHLVVDGVGHDRLAWRGTGRLCLHQVAPAVVPLLLDGGRPTAGKGRRGVQFQAGRGAPDATGVRVGDRRAAGAIAGTDHGGQPAQRVVLIGRGLPVGVGLAHQPFAKAGLGCTLVILIGRDLVLGVGGGEQMHAHAVVGRARAVLLRAAGTAQVPIGIGPSNGVAGGIIAMQGGCHRTSAAAGIGRVGVHARETGQGGRSERIAVAAVEILCAAILRAGPVLHLGLRQQVGQVEAAGSWPDGAEPPAEEG